MEQKQEAAGVDIGKLVVNQEVPVEKPEEHKQEDSKEAEGEGTADTSVEENKVSYSRFKNVHQSWRVAERERDEALAKVDALERQRAERLGSKSNETQDPPQEWFEVTGGDTPQSRKAYQVLRQQFNPSPAQIQELAYQAWQESQASETRRVTDNLRTIDDELDSISMFVGRDLTEQEQSSLLEIMDEYTAKDEEGNYIGPLFSGEKSWEIYELQQEASTASRREGRNRVAALSASGTRGEPSAPNRTETNKAFDPRWEAMDADIERKYGKR